MPVSTRRKILTGRFAVPRRLQLTELLGGSPSVRRSSPRERDEVGHRNAPQLDNSILPFEIWVVHRKGHRIVTKPSLLLRFWAYLSIVCPASVESWFKSGEAINCDGNSLTRHELRFFFVSLGRTNGCCFRPNFPIRRCRSMICRARGSLMDDHQVSARMSIASQMAQPGGRTQFAAEGPRAEQVRRLLFHRRSAVPRNRSVVIMLGNVPHHVAVSCRGSAAGAGWPPGRVSW